MARIAPVDPSSATGKAKTLLGAVQEKLGVTPNMVKTMAAAPAVLEGYLALSGALSQGVLDAKTRERIALVSAETNGCDYCLAAHTLFGKKAGLSDSDMEATRSVSLGQSKSDAAVRLAVDINQSNGQLDQSQFEQARKAGLSDAEIAEVVGHAALNKFTNWFNNVAQTEVDFPRIPLLAKA